MFTNKIIALSLAIFLASALAHGHAAEKSGVGDAAETWDEIAYFRWQAAHGHDLQGDARKTAAFTQKAPDDTATPGDKLDRAGDEKYLASQDYQTATKHWEKAANNFKSAGDLDKARKAMENADQASQVARRTLREGIEIHKAAQEYYEATNNLEKRTEVLGKIARNLERLTDVKR